MARVRNQKNRWERTLEESSRPAAEQYRHQLPGMAGSGGKSIVANRESADVISGRGKRQEIAVSPLAPSPRMQRNTSLAHEQFARELTRLQESEVSATVEMSTGIQMTGKVTNFRRAEDGTIAFVKFTGPTEIMHRGNAIEGQGAEYHHGGYSSPMGPLTRGSLENLAVGQRVDLQYESGITVTGRVTGIVERGGKPAIVVFEDATVMHGSTKLYEPSWGPFDMVVGTMAGVAEGAL